MMKNIKPLMPLLAIVLILSSCNSFDKNSPLVPKDAAFAVHLNTNSLSSKLSWDDIKKSHWFTEIASDQKDSLTKKILDDPSNSGMDTKQGFFVFARRIVNGPSYFGFTGSVKDASAFEAFNKKASESNDMVIKDNLKTILFKGHGSVTWNNNKFLYLSQSDFTPPMTMHGMDSNHVYQAPQPMDYHETARRIFNYKKDSLLVSDNRFASLLTDNGDVHFWTNAESMYEDNPYLNMLSLLRADVYFRETVSATTLTFENGKITGHAQLYSNKEMREIMKKYSGESLDTKLVQRIPSDNVVGLLASNYKPEGIKELLKLGGLDGIVNSFLGDYQLTLDELVNASKGDFLVSVSDLGIKKGKISLGPGMDSLPTNGPTANVLVVMSVKSKAPFEKLMGAAQKLGSSSQLPMAVTFKLTDEFFVAGSNPVLADEFLKGGTTHDFPFLSKISGHPVGFYLDFSKMMSSLKADSSGNDLFSSSANMWKDLIVTGGEFKDDAIQENVEVNLVDQNTNSLQQLNSYIEKLSAGRKKPF